LTALVLLLLVCAAGTAAARDGGGGDDVRVTGTCGRGATSSLRVRSHDGGLEARFRLRQTRGVPGAWRITIVHESRVAARATMRTSSRDDSYEVRRTLRDLTGSDAVVVLARGPRGLGCRAAATLPDASS